MRADVRLLAALALVVSGATAVGAQSRVDGPLLGARRLAADAALKIWVPNGRIRLVAWDRDSLVIRGRIVRPNRFFLAGERASVKFGIDGPDEAAASDLIAWVPRRAML